MEDKQNSGNKYLLQHKLAIEDISGVLFSQFAKAIDFCQDDNRSKSYKRIQGTDPSRNQNDTHPSRELRCECLWTSSPCRGPSRWWPWRWWRRPSSASSQFELDAHCSLSFQEPDRHEKARNLLQPQSRRAFPHLKSFLDVSIQDLAKIWRGKSFVDLKAHCVAVLEVDRLVLSISSSYDVLSELTINILSVIHWCLWHVLRDIRTKSNN